MNNFKMHVISMAITLAFSGAAAAATMSKAEHKAAWNAIAAEFKTASATCASMGGNAKDVCMAEAKGRNQVAKAELDARVTPSNKNNYVVSITRAKADYAIAKEKCDDTSGDANVECLKAARAAQSSATAEAKAQMKSADAAKPAKSAKAPAAAATSNKEAVTEYAEDSVITTKVKAAVFEEPSLKSAEINVETYKGTVQLTGFVSSRADINKAVELARKVKGVTSVKNDMVLKGQK